ncbi:hypothetical protein BH09GEM1_BH09GEM1_34180 [soil metagenome]
MATILSISIVVASPVHAQSAAPLRVLGYTTTVPTTWTARPAASTMRLAEYSVASAASPAAQVVVYFFGQGQGGAVAPNMARWKAQFSNPDGSPVEETVTRETTGAFPITFAEYRGTYARGVGAGNAATAQPNQTLVAGIAETPKGTLFIQLFGPSAAVASARADFVGFVKGLH